MVERVKGKRKAVDSNTSESDDKAEPSRKKRERKESIKPRLLMKSDGNFYSSPKEHQKELWYKRLIYEQKKAFDGFITIDADTVDRNSNKHYYTVKEVLRKIGANLSTIVGDPAEFGERETVLVGGYPRNEASLSHIIEAYNKNHNLKVYDIETQKIVSDYKKRLKQEEMLPGIDFHFGKSLRELGRVRNHDIVIPHPGHTWIVGSLVNEL